MSAEILWIENGPTVIHRQWIIDYVLEKKRLGKFKVLDVGANASSWSYEIVDQTLDIVVNSVHPDRHVGDVMDLKTYHLLDDDYDLIILSHILEDVRDPQFVWENLKNRSKYFFISSPSKHAEFSHVESLQFKGWYHHRWILTSDGESLYSTTKTSLINAFGRNRFNLMAQLGWIYFSKKVLRINPQNFHNYFGYTKLFIKQQKILKHHEHNSISLLVKNNLNFVLEDLDPVGRSIFDMYQDLLTREY